MTSLTQSWLGNVWSAECNETRAINPHALGYTLITSWNQKEMCPCGIVSHSIAFVSSTKTSGPNRKRQGNKTNGPLIHGTASKPNVNGPAEI